MRAVRTQPGTKSPDYLQLRAIFIPTLALLTDRKNNFGVPSQGAEGAVVPTPGAGDALRCRFGGVIGKGRGDRAVRRAERCPCCMGSLSPWPLWATEQDWCTAREQGCFETVFLLSACTSLTMFLCALSNSCLENLCRTRPGGLLCVLIPF